MNELMDLWSLIKGAWILWTVSVLCMVGAGMIVARINHMTAGENGTKDLVFWQHAILAVGFIEVPVMIYVARVMEWGRGPDIALLVLVASIVVFMAMGAHRWRESAPADTSKAT